MHTDPLTASRYPDTNDSTNIAQYFQNLAYDLSVNTVPRFASTSARDSAYAAYISAGGTLTDGRSCFTDDAGYWTRENGVWRSFTGLIGHGIASAGGNYVSGTATRLTSGLPMSAYLKTGHAYEYSCQLRAYTTTSGDVAGIAARVTLGAGGAAATDPQIGGATTVMAATGAGNLYNLTIVRSFQVSTTGSYQFNVWGNRPSGSGTVSFTVMSDGTLYQQVKDNGVALSTLPTPV